MHRVTIILFVVMDLVCVPKKRNLSLFSTEVSERCGNTSELLNGNGKEMLTEGSSDSFGNENISGARRTV